MKLLSWDEEQIELFLRKRAPLVKGAKQPWTYYRDKIKTIGSLSDLSQRPVLLDMIVKTLPTLIASDAPINLPNLYKTYLIGEMKRQKILKKRSQVLSDDDRLALLQQLAIDVYTQRTPVVGFTDCQRYIEQKIKPPKHELEAHTRDFLTNSFLVRIGDGYHFSHKSIMEYLVAARLYFEIHSNEPNDFGTIRLDRVVLNFLKEMSPAPEILLGWIELTKRDSSHGSNLGGNAATLLCALSSDALAGKDLSGSNLTGANLNDADLRNTNLQQANLTNANLGGAKFSASDLKGALLKNTQVLFVLSGSSDAIAKGAREELMSKTISLAVINVPTRPGALCGLIMTVSDLKNLEEIRDLLTSSAVNRVGFYFEDIEAIAGSKRERFRRALDRITRSNREI